MNKKITAIAALFSMLVVAGNRLSAQEVRKLSVKEAVALGLQSSKHLKIDQAKVLEADAALEEAKDRQLPDFKISGSYMRLTTAKIDMKTAQSQDASSGSGSGGGVPKISQAMYGMANLSLPLYAGGKIRYGIQSARYLLEAEKLNAGNDQNGIVYNLIAAYTNLFKAAQVIDVIKENLAASESRDSNFIRLENNGLMARNDRLKAQLQTSGIELQLLEAQSNYNIANVNMDLLLGLPQNTVIAVDPAFINEVPQEQPYTYYEEKAVEGRQDMKALGYQQKAADLGIRAAKAGYLPSLALTGGYVALNIPGFLSVTNAVNAGLGVQYSLSSLWKTGAAVKKAKAQALQLSASREMLSDNIRLQINRDYQNALLAKKKIEVHDKSLIQAEENYRITKNKYDNSLVTITDLLDANVALLSSKINVLNAKADAALAYQKLLESSGMLFQ
ncbi:TolC family protein [Niabella drilacis]|uniref:Outer membrane protein TolC n=1 Tax=Niabella drilacis (strain DSM 25811 / CCM 8410 / CCUG 62505 / LMG 26954 / E90) TaxID=1285928 RepID=A0A1G6I1E7_NIADE|nr:TolC family protein [Niabella drilacis]SDC00379.1 Outer membrane protein TolC [Niabella drilacis]